MAKYDEIGKNYDATRKADTYLVNRLFHHLDVQKGKKYLDIGCGTGNYTIALSHKEVNLIGIDPSAEMLAIAKSKSEKVNWLIGEAENIPLANKSIEGIIGSLTIHHWTNLELGFKELNRVLNKNGFLTIFTSTPKQMEGYWLNHYFPKMLKDSMIQMPSFKKIESAMLSNGFEIIETEKYFIQPDLGDLLLYSGKHNPQLYFAEKTRKGISSFSSLAYDDEVESGLKKLANDIASNKIEEVMSSYKNQNGDYLFIKAKRLD